MNNRKKAKKIVRTKRNYKDSVFKRLFDDREKLAELYNAINGTNYTVADIILTTLDNTIFIGRENDISFKIGDRLIVFVEHQSSIKPHTKRYIERVFIKIWE